MPNSDPSRIAALGSKDDVVRKIQRLGGLELVMLLGIMAKEHCLIQAPMAALDSCAVAIQTIANRTFGLRATCIDCTKSLTTVDFTDSLFLPAERAESSFKNHPIRRASYRAESLSNESSKGIANVIVAKNLQDAPQLVQMQALELMRTQRVFTRSEVYSAPSPFIFLPLTPISSQPLASHLNDFLFISYRHQGHGHHVADDSTSLDQSDDLQEANQLQSSSEDNEWSGVTMTSLDIQHLTQQRDKAVLTVEMKRYLHNVLVFLRMHRGVTGGVTAKASRDFDFLTRCLAPLNDLSFVTPSLVAIAAKKIYPHRLKLVSVDQERSMQYGSDAAAVAKALDGLTPETIIEQVLQEVEVPL